MSLTPKQKSQIKHGAIGALPFGAQYETYKAVKTLTGGSKKMGVAGAAATLATGPIGGVAGVASGVYNGGHPYGAHFSAGHAKAGHPKQAVRPRNT